MKSEERSTKKMKLVLFRSSYFALRTSLFVLCIFTCQETTCCMTALLCFTAILMGQPHEPPLRFRESPAGISAFAQLPADVAARVPVGRLTQEQGEAILSLALLADGTKTPGPAMFGKYERRDTQLNFTPRFAFVANQTYRATLKLDGK